MAKKTGPAIISEENIINKIYFVHGKKVMFVPKAFGNDLAEMYGVETKQLKRQVRRNISRFPADFMFELSPGEYNSLRSQNGALKRDKHAKYLPMAFTEQDVAMLASILNSKTPIEVSIQIIRVFIKMRELLLSNKNILLRLERMEKNMMKQGHKMKKYEEEIQMIFDALKKLLTPPQLPRPKIGFRRSNEKE